MSQVVSVNLLTEKHPWSHTMDVFTQIDFPAFILQLDHFDQHKAELLRVKTLLSDVTEHLNIVEAVGNILSDFSIVRSTKSLNSLLGAKKAGESIVRFRTKLEGLSVERVVDFLIQLIADQNLKDVYLIQSPVDVKLRFTVNGRIHHQGTLGLLLSVQNEPNYSFELAQAASLGQVFDVAMEIIGTISLNGKVYFVNHGLKQICGEIGSDEQRDLSEIMTPSSALKFAEVSMHLTRTLTPWYGSLEFIDVKDHVPVRVFSQVSILTDPIEKSHIGYCVSGFRHDTDNFLIHQIAPLRLALAESERLALVGKIAGHIIHEINNPVTVIHGKAEKIKWLTEDLVKVAPRTDGYLGILESADKVMNMTDRINRIIRGMKNLSRNAQAEALVDVVVSELLAEVYDLVDVISRKRNVTLKFVPVSRALSVKLQRLRMSQVLVNLIHNSVEAVGKDPESWVSVRTTTDHEWVYFSVMDSGQGLPATIKAKIFEGYFSTKDLGEGSGIGLSLSRDIAREHGGDLYLDDSVANTCFVVKLPLSQAHLAQDSNEAWEEL